MTRKVKVTVVYKSGAVVNFKCRRFTSSRSKATGDLTEVTWDAAKPRPFMFGLEHVAAIYVDDTRA